MFGLMVAGVGGRRWLTPVQLADGVGDDVFGRWRVGSCCFGEDLVAGEEGVRVVASGKKKMHEEESTRRRRPKKNKIKEKTKEKARDVKVQQKEKKKKRKGKQMLACAEESSKGEMQ